MQYPILKPQFVRRQGIDGGAVAAITTERREDSNAILMMDLLLNLSLYISEFGKIFHKVFHYFRRKF